MNNLILQSQQPGHNHSGDQNNLAMNESTNLPRCQTRKSPMRDRNSGQQTGTSVQGQEMGCMSTLISTIQILIFQT